MCFKKHLLLLLPLVILAAGCLPQPTLRSDLFLDDQSLISGEPCAPPCWNGIVPGETSFVDAISALTADDARFTDPEQSTDGGILQAAWQKAGSGQYCCRVVAGENDQNSPVSYIFLALSPHIIVDQVIDRYGEPEYVTAFQFTDSEAVIQLVYPEVPMAVTVLVGDPTASLVTNSDVVAVLYMAPEEMELILDTSELQAWNGYQPYAIYAEATPVLTPRITMTPLPEGQ